MPSTHIIIFVMSTSTFSQFYDQIAIHVYMSYIILDSFFKLCDHYELF